MTDTTNIGENPAQTMRKAMETIGMAECIVMPNDEKGETPFNTPHLVSIPEKRRIEDVTDKIQRAAEFLKPARRKGTARLSDLQSLIDWASRFKGDTTALFAQPNMAAPTLTCIADYHAAGPIDATSPSGDPSARHCHHRAVYDFPLSDVW